MTELTSRQILDAMDKALEDISRRFANDPDVQATLVALKSNRKRTVSTDTDAAAGKV